MWPFDRNNTQMYQQYAQAYDTGNFSFFNPGQIISQLSQFIQGAPPDLQQRVYQQHFQQLPYEQREFLARQVPPEYGINPNDPYSMSQGFMRLGQEQPGLLERILQHPVMLGGAMALTGLIAKHMLTEHRERENEQYQQQYDNQYGNQQYGNQFDQYGNQQYGNPQYGNQQYGNQYDQYGNPYGNQGNYPPNQQFNQYGQPTYGRGNEQELRRELRREEREIERLEEREEHHHHHRREEDY
jgi:hypothetical protein